MTATFLEPQLEPVEGPATPWTPDELLELDNRDFHEVVVDAAAGDSEAQWPALTDERVIRRTAGALSSYLNWLHALPRRRKAEMSPAEFEAWLAQHHAHVGRVIHRDNDVKTTKQRLLDEVTRRYKRDARIAVERLARGIQRHRLTCLRAGFEPEEHDRELWGLLEQVTVLLHKEPTPLNDMLGGPWSGPGLAEAGDPR